jgi:hypothetical protein
MASSITLHGASSSSLSTSSRPYDVFLNFRGDDTRDIFICHLYDALKREGIYTYVDEQLRCGEEISEALFKVIKESKITIVVLSENYASSTWCLRELVEILESMETKHVLPIFYKVDPADVRHQRKSFGEALAKHEGRGDTVQSWKAVLTKVANLSGFHLEKGYF